VKAKQRVATAQRAGTLRAMDAMPRVNGQQAALHYDEIASPIGSLRLIASDAALVSIWFERGRDAALDRTPLTRRRSALLDLVRTQLGEYFDGRRRVFELPLDPRGTEFQRRVWNRLQQIEYGATSTTGAIAAALGHSKASRAVGLANGSHPIPNDSPCHRDIGADGSLTGFGGVLAIKSSLLELERGEVEPRLL
jgi:methylated-DNA-[protein]-cysteine S-methyltransferase